METEATNNEKPNVPKRITLGGLVTMAPKGWEDATLLIADVGDPHPVYEVSFVIDKHQRVAILLSEYRRRSIKD